eukprot:TRINITY_DN3770_c0_g1_i1.p1 TRINITY_DN3770_c0_g1~~TRINITY_DN3770_c0_g1_i1.p1  ORF type:complete len:1599 (-),score=326.43 TRINITY_DN3770_c0_g1_i1:1345-6141(-)
MLALPRVCAKKLNYVTQIDTLVLKNRMMATNEPDSPRSDVAAPEDAEEGSPNLIDQPEDVAESDPIFDFQAPANQSDLLKMANADLAEASESGFFLSIEAAAEAAQSLAPTVVTQSGTLCAALNQLRPLNSAKERQAQNNFFAEASPQLVDIVASLGTAEPFLVDGDALFLHAQTLSQAVDTTSGLPNVVQIAYLMETVLVRMLRAGMRVHLFFFDSGLLGWHGALLMARVLLLKHFLALSLTEAYSRKPDHQILPTGSELLVKRMDSPICKQFLAYLHVPPPAYAFVWTSSPPPGVNADAADISRWTAYKLNRLSILPLSLEYWDFAGSRVFAAQFVVPQKAYKFGDLDLVVSQLPKLPDEFSGPPSVSATQFPSAHLGPTFELFFLVHHLVLLHTIPVDQRTFDRKVLSNPEILQRLPMLTRVHALALELLDDAALFCHGVHLYCVPKQLRWVLLVPEPQLLLVSILALGASGLSGRQFLHEQLSPGDSWSLAARVWAWLTKQPESCTPPECPWTFSNEDQRFFSRVLGEMRSASAEAHARLLPENLRFLRPGGTESLRTVFPTEVELVEQLSDTAATVLPNILQGPHLENSHWHNWTGFFHKNDIFYVKPREWPAYMDEWNPEKRRRALERLRHKEANALDRYQRALKSTADLAPLNGISPGRVLVQEARARAQVDSCHRRCALPEQLERREPTAAPALTSVDRIKAKIEFDNLRTSRHGEVQITDWARQQLHIRGGPTRQVLTDVAATFGSVSPLVELWFSQSLEAKGHGNADLNAVRQLLEITSIRFEAEKALLASVSSEMKIFEIFYLLQNSLARTYLSDTFLQVLQQYQEKQATRELATAVNTRQRDYFAQALVTALTHFPDENFCRRIRELAHRQRAEPPAKSTIIENPFCSFFAFQMSNPAVSSKLVRSQKTPDDERVGFGPDAWQKHLLDVVDAGQSALIVAPTSSGKTFVSFHAMRRILMQSDTDVCVYVCPSKALVYQMRADVTRRLRKRTDGGDVNVLGVFTREDRDNVERAQILITVPACLEILLLSPQHPQWVSRVKYMIFDEVHTIMAEEGTIWERLLLLVNAPILALSATVGNVSEFAGWLQRIEMAKQRNRNERKSLLLSDLPADLHAGTITQHVRMLCRNIHFQFERLGVGSDVGYLHFDGADELDRARRALGDFLKINRNKISVDLCMPDEPKLHVIEYYERHNDLKPFLYSPDKGLFRLYSLGALNPPPPGEKLVLPVDFKLLPEDCVFCVNFLYNWGKRGKKGAIRPFVEPYLPEKFFRTTDTNLMMMLSREAAVRYEGAVKRLLVDLSGTRGDAHSALTDLMAKLRKPLTVPRNFNMLEELLPMLRKVDDQDMMPAILFRFSQLGCRALLQRMVTELEAKEREEFPEIENRLREIHEEVRRIKQILRTPRMEHEAAQPEASRSEEYQELLARFHALISEAQQLLAPQPGFFFVDHSDRSKQLNADEIKERFPINAHNRTLIMRALTRGIGIHHAGLPKKLRQTVQRMFALGHLRLVISTGTLTMGLHMPCRSVIFYGTDVWLGALNWRQAAGRAGRRGFDTQGNSIFYGTKDSKILQLYRSKLPSICWSCWASWI